LLLSEQVASGCCVLLQRCSWQVLMQVLQMARLMQQQQQQQLVLRLCGMLPWALSRCLLLLLLLC
jgi:hypothetical protein